VEPLFQVLRKQHRERFGKKAFGKGSGFA